MSPGRSSPVHIVGISAYYHDSAACLISNGKIVAAAQEERFTRRKHDADFPSHALEYCLRQGGVALEDVDYLAYYEKPLLKLERILTTHLACAPFGLVQYLRSMPTWLKRKAFTAREIRTACGYTGPLLYPAHHVSHAASAFYPSPFERAAIVTADGVGEWATSSIGFGDGNRIELLKEIRFPHSIGLLYSAFTYYAGFKVNSGEYKLMGLAPYGEPKYVSTILEHLIDLKPDGSFRLDLTYFNYLTGLTMTNDRFHALLGGPPRAPESPLRQRDMDLARSIQDVTEEVMLRMVRHALSLTGARNLCLAGGVALNCVANGRILRECALDGIWVQPAAGDAGGALGAALATWHDYLEQPRSVEPGDAQHGSLLGPSYSDDEIEAWARTRSYPFRRVEEGALAATVASAIAVEQVVGWFQGRMEYGPRALGARSILGDARSPHMQTTMNLKIKFRESFRPFAPSVLLDDAPDWFELDCRSPYMLLVAPVRDSRRVSPPEGDAWGLDKLKQPRSTIPSVTHVDHTARIQTVEREVNPRYFDLLTELKAQTACPVVVNTSFNVRGEPVVCSLDDAYRCFMRTDIELLVLGTCLFEKRAQPPLAEKEDWRDAYGLD